MRYGHGVRPVRARALRSQAGPQAGWPATGPRLFGLALSVTLAWKWSPQSASELACKWSTQRAAAQGMTSTAQKLKPEHIAQLSDEECGELLHLWRAWARSTQLPPDGDWITWLYMAGRGAGKTRTASEWIRQRVYDGSQSIALVGRTPADVRDVMIEGDSGLLNVFPPHERPKHEPSNRRIIFHTGAVGHVYSSEQPDHLRGPQHDTAWCDEMATFKARAAWDNLQLGLRLGSPRQIVTTTPKPVAAMRELVRNPHTVLTRDTSYANRANLAPAFFAQVIQMYEGTARGQQEIMGMLLDSLPGALWTREMIRYRLTPPTTRRCIGVDPSIGDGETSDECGIVGVGMADDKNLDVLGDWSIRASPL